MDTKKIIVSVLFIIIGIFLIRYALIRPCEVEAITQKVNGDISIEQPEQLDRLLCLSTDYMALVALLIGTATIFPGVGGLFKGLTEDPSSAGASKSKKKKKK